MKDFLLLVGLITLLLALYLVYTSSDSIVSRGLLGISIFSLALTMRRIDVAHQQEVQEQLNQYESSAQLHNHE
jgi:hypothetical protein